MTAASIRASVCMLSSQSPIRANETNAASTMSAGRQPPKRNTTITPAAITPGQVSQSSASSNAVTSHSASARKPSRIAKTRFGLSAVRSSSSQVWNSSRRSGSSLQVSDAGQGSSSRQSANAEQHHRDDARHLHGPAAPAGGGTRQRRRADPAASDRHPEPRTWRPGSLRGPRSRPCGRSSTARTGLSDRPPSAPRPSRRSTRRARGPSWSSSGRGSRMIQRSVSTCVRGTSRTKFCTYSFCGRPHKLFGVPTCTMRRRA